jgi:hypothetical protein
MKKNRSEKNLLYFIAIVTNLYLYLSVIIFSIYLIIPFIGGIFSAKALVIYGSWIGIAFALKYLINKIQKDILLKWYEFLILFLYGTVCMFLWFPMPFNILFSIFIAIANIVGYRAQIRLLVKDK